MSALTKFLLLLILSLLTFFPLAGSALAQNQSTASASLYNTSVSPTSPQYTDLMIGNLIHTFSCLTVGSSIINQPCLSYTPTSNGQGGISFNPTFSRTNNSGGMLGWVSTGLLALYSTPPVQVSDYLAVVGQDFGVVREAHAQVGGAGSSVLGPVITLWQVSRNISYVVMIIMFVIIGFMVMFRQKLNPQTVITAQTALPGLVVGLILITFSYFMASLIVDTAYIATNVVGQYFNLAQKQTGVQDLVSKTANENVLSMFSRFVGTISTGDISGAISNVWDASSSTVQFILRAFAGLMAFQYGSAVGPALGSLIGAAAGTAIFPTLGTAAGGALGSALGGPIIGAITGVAAFAAPVQVLSLVLWVVAIAVMIITMFRLLLKLLTNYLNIIFLTVTAPFHFLLASLPGRQGLVTDWIRNMLCNTLAFPAVMAVFYFAAYMMAGLGTDKAPVIFFDIKNTTDLTGAGTLPLLGGLKLSFIRLAIAYTALLATPTIPDIICQAIGKPSKYGSMIEQAVMGGTKAGQGRVQEFAGSAGKTFSSLNTLLPKNELNYLASSGKYEYLNKESPLATAVRGLKTGKLNP